MSEFLCPWEAAQYFIYSSNVPTLLYYSHIPSIIAALAIVLLILPKTKRTLVTKLLSIMFFVFIAWSISDLILWATNRADVTVFFWSTQILLEVLVYALAFYVSYVFIFNEDLSFRNKFLLTMPIAVFSLLIPTNFTITGVELGTCYAIENPVIIFLSYIFEAFFIIAIAIMSLRGYRTVAQNKKKQIIGYSLGIIVFLLALTYGNMIGSFSDDWVVAQYGLFGIPVFIAFLTYTIVKFRLFAVKLLGAQALVVTLWVLIGSMLLVVQSTASRSIVVFTLVLSFMFGIFLIRSVKKEVTQREQIEKLAVDLRHTNSNLEHANDRLKELDKQKTEFVSFATHQLRSPLTAMKGYSSLILEGDYGEISPDLRDAVQKIHESTNTLTNVVNDYLNISRIELGTMKYDFKSLDLKDVVREVVGELQPNIDKAGIKFSFEVDARAKYLVKIDIDKFKQVLANIIDNSIKYTPSGSIVVSVKKDTSKNTITFAVKDTGIGMAEGVIPKLFAKFSRAENANKVNIRGTGLGLFVAKEIVKAHGGKVWAESEGEGKGSQFYVELPAEK